MDSEASQEDSKETGSNLGFAAAYADRTRVQRNASVHADGSLRIHGLTAVMAEIVPLPFGGTATSTDHGFIGLISLTTMLAIIHFSLFPMLETYSKLPYYFMPIDQNL